MSTNRKRCYISGPMSGKPHYNVEAFGRAKAKWQAEGWDVVTPFDTNSIVWQRHFGRDFDPYADSCEYGDPLLGEMFVEDVRAIHEAGHVVMLNGWEDSRGATVELLVADLLGCQVWSQDGNREVKRLRCIIGPDAEPPEAHAETVCQEADRIVSGDRGKAYGHPFDDYTRTGTMWGAILQGWADKAAAANKPLPVPPELAIMCMVAVKLSREVNAPKRDNRVDMCGYTKCLDMVRERQEAE